MDESVSTADNNDDEEELMNVEVNGDSNESHIWESVSRLRSDVMFSKSFVSNILDTAKSPFDIYSLVHFLLIY